MFSPTRKLDRSSPQFLIERNIRGKFLSEGKTGGRMLWFLKKAPVPLREALPPRPECICVFYAPSHAIYYIPSKLYLSRVHHPSVKPASKRCTARPFGTDYPLAAPGKEAFHIQPTGLLNQSSLTPLIRRRLIF
jgi:hypothetical protein